MKIIHAAFIATLLGTPAIAACPVGSDLETGIKVTYADGLIEFFRRLDADRVEVMMPGESPPMRDVAGKGLYLLRSADWIDGAESNTLTVDFGMMPETLPTPAPGMSVVLPVVEYYDDEPVSITETYVSGPVQQVTIGDCTLLAIDIKLTRTDEETPDVIEVVRYFPDLGFGHIYALGDAGAPLETFPATRIEPVR